MRSKQKGQKKVNTQCESKWRQCLFPSEKEREKRKKELRKERDGQWTVSEVDKFYNVIRIDTDRSPLEWLWKDWKLFSSYNTVLIVYL